MCTRGSACILNSEGRYTKQDILILLVIWQKNSVEKKKEKKNESGVKRIENRVIYIVQDTIWDVLEYKIKPIKITSIVAQYSIRSKKIDFLVFSHVLRKHIKLL